MRLILLRTPLTSPLDDMASSDSIYISRSTRRLRWGPETFQCPRMEQLGIVINRDHNVAICLVCSSAIVPRSLYQHIRKPGRHQKGDFHQGWRLSFATRDFCQWLIKNHGLVDPCRKRPTAIVTLVFGLPISQGFYCCAKCGYAVQAKVTIKRHLRNCKEGKMIKGSCQTWFPSSRQNHFSITVHNHLHPDPPSSASLFIKQFTFNPYKNTPVQMAVHPRDMNIFLNYENWLEEVEGMTGVQISEISWNALPKLRPIVRAVVKEYTKRLSGHGIFRTCVLPNLPYNKTITNHFSLISLILLRFHDSMTFTNDHDY